MSFYIYTTPDGSHFRHDDDPDTVTVLDDSMQPLSATFPKLDEDCDSAASVTSNRFAMGCWSGTDLTLFDLKSGESLTTFPFQKIGPLRFDVTGERLYFKTGSQVMLLEVNSSKATQIKGIRELDEVVPLRDSNDVLVSSQTKGELLKLSLSSGQVTAIPLPIDGTLFDLKRSPNGEHLILIDRKKGVHRVNISDWSIVWSVSLKKTLGTDHMGVGQFSGDGTLFGASIAATDRNYTIVLDTATGKQVAEFDAVCEGLPFRGTMIRDAATQMDSYFADTLDLANGQIGRVDLRTNK